MDGWMHVPRIFTCNADTNLRRMQSPARAPTDKMTAQRHQDVKTIYFVQTESNRLVARKYCWVEKLVPTDVEHKAKTENRFRSDAMDAQTGRIHAICSEFSNLGVRDHGQGSDRMLRLDNDWRHHRCFCR